MLKVNELGERRADRRHAVRDKAGHPEALLLEVGESLICPVLCSLRIEAVRNAKKSHPTATSRNTHGLEREDNGGR